MAYRENTYLQAAAIVLVLAVVALGVMSYMFFRQTEELAKKLKAAETERANTQKAADLLAFEVQYLHHIVGHNQKEPQEIESLLSNLQSVPDVVAINEQFETHRQTFALGQPNQESMVYPDFPEPLLQKIQSMNTTAVDELREKNQLLTQIQEEQSKQEKMRTDFEAEKTKLASNLQAVQRDMTAQFNSTSAKMNTVEAQVASKDQTIRTIQNKANKEIDQLSKAIHNKDQLVLAYKEKANREKKETFEVADGLITQINQKTRYVYLNLGSDDLLTRQINFTVYGKNVTAVANAKPKGRIEVTKVLGRKQAEAKILDDNVLDPILPGDKVFSPVWQPGRKQHFALAGPMDFDDDGIDDRQKVKTLILMNGGVIDAELHDDGSITGKVTVDTRYIVKGARPTEKSSPKLQEGYTNLIGQATQYGVEQISVEKLLGQLGRQNLKKTVRLGSGDDRDGAAARKPATPNNRFQPRQPRSAF